MTGVGDETDQTLPFLPAPQPVVRDADAVVPDAAPVVPVATPAVAASSLSEAVGPTLADAMATRNVSTVRPAIDYGLPAQPVTPVAVSEEFVRPELESMGPPTTALLIGRGLMVLAVLLIGIAAHRTTGPARADRGEAFWPVAVSAAVFVTVGIAGLVFWSVKLAGNAHRLKARAASPRSAGWSWAPLIVWVVGSSLTYLRIDVDAELDPLPGVAGVGLALSLAIPYARLQGVFGGLSRRPPVLWFNAFPLDLLAFGLVWWRLTSWPDPVTVSDADHVRLTSYIAFGAAAALTVNLIVFVALAQRGSSAVYERLGRLEMRHRGDQPSRPEWFTAGLQVKPGSKLDPRPLVSTGPLSAMVAAFHMLWGISLALFGVALARLAFEYSDRPSFDGLLALDGEDAENIAVVAGVGVLVYVVTIIVHAVWSVLVALNARRVTVHAPNPATFGIVFAPMPVLVVTGLLIGGTVGYWVVLAGLAFAFFALMGANRMLMALSARLGGQLRGFSNWTALIGVAYLVGVVENIVFSNVAGRLGFFATASLLQGVLIGIGGVIGFRAMRALEATLTSARQAGRQPESA